MMLDDIIENKKREVEKLKEVQQGIDIEKLVKSLPPARNFARALRGKPSLIAEMKRSSPSAGTIMESFDPVYLAKVYEAAGADALSVLTDSKYFGGSVDDLKAVRGATELPILRKDFIIDRSQVYESRMIGADAILLIVRILTDKQLSSLLETAKNIGIAALVEVHNTFEAKRALALGADIIGINNRDLDTLTVDIANTEKIISAIPDLKKKVLVSESGIRSQEDVDRVVKCGAHAVLVGESILKSDNIAQKIRELKLHS